MYNPFMKRATEYLRDDRSFLAAVSPEPLITYFAKPAAEDRLYDRLAVIIGTPGSGKTTIARLFQVSTLLTLSQNEGMDFFQSLMDAMRACGATKDGLPCVAGTRIPLETEYREIWQFPYSEEVRFGILTTLIQARAMLGWIKGFTDSGIPIGDISITTKSTAEAAVHFIGGKNGAGLLERAKQVEKAIYQVSSALVPPKLTGGDDELSQSLSSYRPFDVLESFTIAGRPLSLKPLVILDDAHSLHYAQFASMHRWLARRELAISRWMLTRIDSLNPEDVLSLSSENPNSDVKRSREITQVLFQGTGDRIAHRKAFRKMAKDMAGRYLQLMEVFSRHHIADMSSLLLSDEPILSGSKLEKLQSDIATLKKKNKVTEQRLGQIENVVDEYLGKNDSVRPDVRLGMIYILLNRYINRTESAGQQSIFSDDVISDPEPSRPIEAGPDIASGARIQLSHKYDRPYYFGIDALCDASSENAEQFLHLASSLVARAETQLIRGKKAPLSVSDQHNILTERAKKIIDEWSFPYHKEVRGLVAVVTQKALSRSLEPTAPLGAGACGIGILQDEFLQIPERHPELARVLKFAIAYSALFINTGVLVKRKTWCVIELGGIPLVASGLTLSRGGFVQDNTKTLLRVLEPQS